MSAPDQKAWKATRDEMEEIHGIREGQGRGRGWDYDLLWLEARGIVNAVASRRALAELKALADTICERCCSGLPSDGFFDHALQVGEEEWEQVQCYANPIRVRIAEIEAEG